MVLRIQCIATIHYILQTRFVQQIITAIQTQSGDMIFSKYKSSICTVDRIRVIKGFTNLNVYYIILWKILQYIVPII